MVRFADTTTDRGIGVFGCERSSLQGQGVLVAAPGYREAVGNHDSSSAEGGYAPTRVGTTMRESGARCI